MNCECHCNGKCKLLGGLEQKIMEVLWSSEESLKPAQVLKQINGDYAYTTIMTVLKRMYDKKLVSRKMKGNAFFYKALQPKADFASDCLDDLFYRLFDSYGEFTVDSFVKIAKEQGYKI